MKNSRTPLSITLVTILCMLPVVAFPWMLSHCPDIPSYLTILKIYPFYVVLTGLLAWLSWRERPWITWTLLVVLCLSHMAAWILVLVP